MSAVLRFTTTGKPKVWRGPLGIWWVSWPLPMPWSPTPHLSWDSAMATVNRGRPNRDH